MKKYRTLKSIFHEQGREAADQEAARRREAWFETDFKLGDKTLFYAVNRQLLLLQEQVFSNERIIESLAAEIPFAGQRSYLYELIMQEISATNELEGIRSTRQQIQEALSASPAEKKEFKEIARLYLEFSRGGVETPLNPQEIRQTYDKLFGSEISAEDALDGELFRVGPVYILDGSGQQIHAGSSSEAEIFSQLQAMQDHLEEDQVSFLFSRLAAHFMFEAVHPFYDGNGRFGRFLLSAQLGQALSVYTVLTLSHVINQQKRAYYKAFTAVEDPLNQGEATLFVQVMLGFIRDAQQQLIKDFTQKKQQLDFLVERLEELGGQGQLADSLAGTLFVLGQVALFNPGFGISWDELAEAVGKSKRKTREDLAALEEDGLVERISSKPLRVRLSQAGRELLLLEDS